jgi:hypothetical protein
MRNRTALLLIVSAIVLGAGVVHGVYTNRWGASAELVELAHRIDLLPKQVGDWEGSEVPHSDREWQAAGALGHLSRKYTRRSDGASIGVFLLAGRPSDISSHTPDVCYPGAGYQLETPQKTKLSEGEHAAVFNAQARSTDATAGGDLRIFWAWNDGQGWQAPEDPRLSFVSRHALVKLYVVVEESSTRAPGSSSTDIVTEFLGLWLPTSHEALFKSTEKAGNPETR